MPARFRFVLITHLTAMAVLLASCAANTDPNLAISPRTRLTDPVVPSDRLRRPVDGNNDLAFDLYQTLRAGEGNLVYSSFSISLALAMAYAGAR
jgi:serine protease inhibitor